ncbi:helix-turn-helix transcriptional regulator [Actinomadura litoris]|uniref:helix-turn-helix transcriptional regulator n=1 Tax=Actinomadura litoris TaxID=2678616 RepID=UPI001FA7090E|nr:helix-turn-helix transcriptional regulator [Actinomadura litoris]
MIRALDTTQELAAFLRSRRERLDPHDFDLPTRSRTRRTPGLRREEVAELAGISIDYIVRLEQARGLRPSAEVLGSLAQALRLTSAERAYLFDLARQRPTTPARPTPDRPNAAAAPPLARLVADLSPLPAMLTNHRYDILAWNTEMSRLLLDFDTLPPHQRNSMWLCLMRPEMRDFYVDRERIVREGIAHLRTVWAAHPEDEALSALIAEFATDPDFARLWDERDVKVHGRGRKRMRHPEVGLVAVDFETLTPLDDPDLQLVIFRAADGESQSALDRLNAG